MAPKAPRSFRRGCVRAWRDLPYRPQCDRVNVPNLGDGDQVPALPPVCGQGLGVHPSRGLTVAGDFPGSPAVPSHRRRGRCRAAPRPPAGSGCCPRSRWNCAPPDARCHPRSRPLRPATAGHPAGPSLLRRPRNGRTHRPDEIVRVATSRPQFVTVVGWLNIQHNFGWGRPRSGRLPQCRQRARGGAMLLALADPAFGVPPQDNSPAD